MTKLKCNYPDCSYKVTDDPKDKDKDAEYNFDVYYTMAMHWDNSHMDFEEVVLEEDIDETL